MLHTGRHERVYHTFWSVLAQFLLPASDVSFSVVIPTLGSKSVPTRFCVWSEADGLHPRLSLLGSIMASLGAFWSSG